MRILAVDDDEVSLLLLTETLRALNHDVVGVADGRSAVARMEREFFPLVITDWVMPGMDGLELCRWIRSQRMPKYCYVILLTSRQGTAATVEGLNSGADEYLPKPVDPRELQMRVRIAERIVEMQSRDVAIFAMAKLAEARDPETGQHLERVREFVAILARSLRTMGVYTDMLTSRFIETLYSTCPLHDIGKIGIPDKILLKADRLTDSEFQVMKTHTTIGAETLESAIREYPHDDYLIMGRDIALTHHERYNGAGYPRGLAGNDIPLCGRIMALADVYDALVSSRVYKTAMSHEVAREIVIQGAGEHFDPKIVQAFIEAEGEFIAMVKK